MKPLFCSSISAIAPIYKFCLIQTQNYSTGAGVWTLGT
ncbi:hypothetical protein MC7420_2839 [Coleofasciculus chthonoplastes PCC 7420]|uniref:Uncharacterized protein n=1 Tax=Coleofasciculus chthonoplastes PCC 7420 TaxID=118168 RepID=B4VK33_9CYAN|nr:hypothetical protein MC7420_2839 [Coleofasciculus chthonoplastes PCC 7420]